MDSVIVVDLRVGDLALNMHTRDKLGRCSLRSGTVKDLVHCDKWYRDGGGGGGGKSLDIRCYLTSSRAWMKTPGHGSARLGFIVVDLRVGELVLNMHTRDYDVESCADLLEGRP